MIRTAQIIDLNWTISIRDNTRNGRFQENPNKLNYEQNSNRCHFQRCTNTFRINRMSGLCDTHAEHRHDLYLELSDPTGQIVQAPSHKDIIDSLILWAKPRNFDLVPLFEAMSFNVLGNIPDVSTLARDVLHTGFTPPLLQDLLNDIAFVVNEFLPDFNNSSYQPLRTRRGDIPARILALTFAGLILCEEANRGDRWFSRMIRRDESQTTMLGGAMPLAYFAAKSFRWGVELGKASHNLTQ